METLGQVMDLGRQADSRLESPSESRKRYTSKDVLDGIIASAREVPKPEHCKYCGATLYHEAIVFGGKAVLFNTMPVRCTCPQAVAFWQRRDAADAKKRADEAEAEERAKKQRRIERMLGRSGIKKRFMQRTFENFKRDTPERSRCYTAAKDYADSFPAHAAKGEGLYIEGTNGTGKTHLAAAITLQLIEQGYPVVCKTSIDLLADIKRGFESGEATEYDVLRAYKDVDLLIVDDLGKEQCTDWSVSTLYGILNDRYEDMKPTIITTNYNTDDLIKAMTPRGMDDTKIRAIVSRLHETNAVITMAWDDARGGGA